jgi:Rne/Rng family ribonuclease
MASEILYSWGPGESRLALVRDGRLVDLAVVRPELLAGAVLLGRVVDLAPKMGAVFVDIGQEKPGFLQGVKGLTQGQAVLVQVKADAQGLKGATLTTEVVLSGRFMSFTPMRPGLSVPRKLSDDRRGLLQERLACMMGDDEGIVARLHAVNADEPALEADLLALRGQWEQVCQSQGSARAPAVLWRPDPLDRMLSDHPGVSRVLVDDDLAFAQAQARLGGLVERHRDGSVFSLYDVEDAFAACLAPVVALPCGGRVTFQGTAALTAIDVDSGPAAPIEANQQAVSVIARQLRLRNIAGQIIVDFVSAGGKGGLIKLIAALKQSISSDPTATHVIGATALGLVEMTRERRGPSLADLMVENTIVPSAEATALRALRLLLSEALHRPGRALTLDLAADVAAALYARPAALAEIESRLGRKPTIRAAAGIGRDDVIVSEG